MTVFEFVMTFFLWSAFIYVPLFYGGSKYNGEFWAGMTAVWAGGLVVLGMAAHLLA